MKLIFSISLNILLLLVFTTAPTSYVRACCGGKDKNAKEVTEHKAKCQKDCCKKQQSPSKNSKKKCCGDNCECAVSIIVIADLSAQPPLSILSNFVPVFVEKRTFSYKRAVVQSTIQDIWQPPMTILSV